MKTIAILTCWYGKYPWYLPYFIHSCKYNPSIDFFIITDNEDSIRNKPENVKIIFMTIDEIKQKAERKLKFAINIDYPYKLCDIKPAYGYLFSELIVGYDFWGHADIDIIYGNIREFITDELLKNYDVISSRHDYVTGSFCLFRNSENINKLFTNSKDYKKVFGNHEHYCFDECNFLFSELENGKSIFDFPERIQSMTYVVKKAAEENRINAFFDFMIIEGVPGRIKWLNGRILYKNKYEAMYYHLIALKEVYKPIISNNMNIGKTFRISKSRIYK